MEGWNIYLFSSQFAWKKCKWLWGLFQFKLRKYIWLYSNLKSCYRERELRQDIFFTCTQDTLQYLWGGICSIRVIVPWCYRWEGSCFKAHSQPEFSGRVQILQKLIKLLPSSWSARCKTFTPALNVTIRSGLLLRGRSRDVMYYWQRCTGSTHPTNMESSGLTYLLWLPLLQTTLLPGQSFQAGQGSVYSPVSVSCVAGEH